MFDVRAGFRDAGLALSCLWLGACGGDEQGGGPGGGQAPTDEPRPDRSPDIERGFELQPGELDLGLIASTQVVETGFDVINTGDVDLSITEIVGSCGCLRFFYERGAVPPGGTRHIAVEVGTNNRGNKALTADVRVRQGGVLGSKRLHMQSFARAPFAFTPKQCNLGRRPFGEPMSIAIVARVDLPQDVPLTPLVVRDPGALLERGVQIDVGEPVVTPRGPMRCVEYTMNLTASADVAQSHVGALVFEADWIEPSMLSVHGAVHPGWYLDPDELHIGSARLGRSRERETRLFHTGDQMPQVTSIVSSLPCVAVEVMPVEGRQSQRVVVRFTPEVVGEVEAVVELHHDRSDQPMLLHVKGRGR